jgi:hypothetical protein
MRTKKWKMASELRTDPQMESDRKCIKTKAAGCDGYARDRVAV